MSRRAVRLGGGLYTPPKPGSQDGAFVVFGMTVREVATLEFEQLDGELVTIVPEDLSRQFGIGFFLVAFEVPRGRGRPVRELRVRDPISHRPGLQRPRLGRHQRTVLEHPEAPDSLARRLTCAARPERLELPTF